jgi:hypothetical protein
MLAPCYAKLLFLLIISESKDIKPKIGFFTMWSKLQDTTVIYKDKSPTTAS